MAVGFEMEQAVEGYAQELDVVGSLRRFPATVMAQSAKSRTRTRTARLPGMTLSEAVRDTASRPEE